MNAYIFTINWPDGNSSLDESSINVRYSLLFSFGLTEMKALG
jgi:hypothetical protein